MQSVSNDNFGPLVAYIVPGVTTLAGLSVFSPALRGWFSLSPTDAPTISGFLYLTLASVAAGMTVSAIRWAIVDTFHAWTGLRAPVLDFGRLGPNVGAFTLLIEIHYRHYLFYANMLVALAIAYGCARWSDERIGWPWLDLAALLLAAVFFLASRDTLRKYYHRTGLLLKNPLHHNSPAGNAKGKPRENHESVTP